MWQSRAVRVPLFLYSRTQLCTGFLFSSFVQWLGSWQLLSDCFFLSLSLRFCLYSWSHFPFDGQAHCPHTRCKHQRTRGRTPSFFAGIKCGQCSTIDVIDNWTSRCGIDCDNKCLNVNRHLSIFARSQMHARAQFECCATLLTFRNETKIVVWPTRKVKLGGQSHFNFISFKCSPYGACCCYTASNERPSLLKRECKKKKLKGKELT